MVFGSKDFNVFEDRAVRAIISESSKNKVVLDLQKYRLERYHERSTRDHVL
jgi:hypothetical protein